MFHAEEMPPIQIDFVNQAEIGGPYGAKSVGECSLVPVAAAVVNAVSNALDYSFDSLPITSDKIFEALEKSKVDPIVKTKLSRIE